MRIKSINPKLSMLIVGMTVTAAGILSSCSKTNNTPAGPTGPTAPTNPGNYDSADQIQSASRVTFWSFNGTLTDSVTGTTATSSGVTWGTGMIAGRQAFQGSATTYAYSTTPGALSSLQSFTASVWINSAQVTSGTNEEAFFQLVDSTQWQSNIHLGLIPSSSSDTLTLGLKIQNWPGDTAVQYGTYYLNAYLDTAVGKWTNVVVTYSGASSIVNVYENGTLIAVNGPYTNYPGYTGLELFRTDPGTPPVGGTPNSNPNTAAPWGNLTFKNATGVVFGAWSVNTTPPLSDNGSEPWAGNYLGEMENLRVWSTALNATDVNSLYILEKAGF